jgi:hypothetical protein
MGRHTPDTGDHGPLVLAQLRSETFFSALTRRRIRRGSFHSIVDLQAAINRYIAEHNADPKPFTWTQTPEHILTKLSPLNLDFPLGEGLRHGDADFKLMSVPLHPVPARPVFSVEVPSQLSCSTLDLFLGPLGVLLAHEIPEGPCLVVVGELLQLPQSVPMGGNLIGYVEQGFDGVDQHRPLGWI